MNFVCSAALWWVYQAPYFLSEWMKCIPLTTLTPDHYQILTESLVSGSVKFWIELWTEVAVTCIVPYAANIKFWCNYPGRLCRSAWVGFLSQSVCLFVCSQHKSKTNDPKVFKLGIGNDLGISYKWHGFRFRGQKSTLGLGLTAIRRGFKLYECLLVLAIMNMKSAINDWRMIIVVA